MKLGRKNERIKALSHHQSKFISGNLSSGSVVERQNDEQQDEKKKKRTTVSEEERPKIGSTNNTWPNYQGVKTVMGFSNVLKCLRMASIICTCSHTLYPMVGAGCSGSSRDLWKKEFACCTHLRNFPIGFLFISFPSRILTRKRIKPMVELSPGLCICGHNIWLN